MKSCFLGLLGRVSNTSLTKHQTWSRGGSLTMPPGQDNVIPFGDVVILPRGRLAVSGYSGDDSWMKTKHGLGVLQRR